MKDLQRSTKIWLVLNTVISPCLFAALTETEMSRYNRYSTYSTDLINLTVVIWMPFVAWIGLKWATKIELRNKWLERLVLFVKIMIMLGSYFVAIAEAFQL